VELEPHEIILDGITYGYPAVYDTLMFFYNSKLPDRYYSIFNLKTGKHIGDFCPKGQGPGEARVVSLIYQFYRENGELKTLLLAPLNYKIAVWNISASIAGNKTVWDFVPYDWRKDRDEICANVTVRLNSKEFICQITPLFLDPEDTYCTNSTVLHYEKRTLYSDSLIRKYTIFKQSLKHTYSDRLLGSWDCVKPDGSKIVQFMIHMWQINTIDIETGKVTAYRPVEKFPGFSYLANFMEPHEQLPGYFIWAVSNDKYVLALYCNGLKGEKRKNNLVVYVFDWDCNLLKKVKLKNESIYYDLALDNDNNLYTVAPNDEGETICRYDLKSTGL
jgi:hypothetical protein